MNNFEDLRAGLESALQKIAHIYNSLVGGSEKVKIILALYDGEKQLSDPLTEPSGKWELECSINEIDSTDVKEMIGRLSDHII